MTFSSSDLYLVYYSRSKVSYDARRDNDSIRRRLLQTHFYLICKLGSTGRFSSSFGRVSSQFCEWLTSCLYDR